MQPYRQPTLPIEPASALRRAHLRLVTEETSSVVVGPRCRCGHGRGAHEHYRGGTDCATCACLRFARPVLDQLGRHSR
jgi:hypothetical protein